MKIEITKEELKRVVAVCAPMVAHTSSTPIVECVLISASSDEAKMFAYDFTNSVSCNMDARIIAPGELVLPAKMLMDILSNVGDDIICLEVVGSNCMFRSGSCSYELPLTDASLFPEMPSVQDMNALPWVEIDLQDFKSAYKKVAACCASGTNAAVSGVHIETSGKDVQVVGCDGYRVSIAKLSGSCSESLCFTLDKTVARAIASVIGDKVRIHVGRRYNVACIDEIQYIARTFSDAFIDYKRAMAYDIAETVTVSKKNLEQAIKSALPIVDNAAKTPLKLTFGDKLVVQSYSARGHVKTSCDLDDRSGNNEPIEIGVNSRFLLDSIAACDTDKLQIRLKNSISPIRVQDENTDVMVLPMRLRKAA